MKFSPEVKFVFFFFLAFLIAAFVLGSKPARAQQDTVQLQSRTDELIGSFDTLVSEFSTEFDSKGSRSQNISLAAKNFEKLVVKPGETVSFNGLVGRRGPDRGYKLAKAINGGKMVKEYGGGTCQVSGTLHAALINSGVVEILEHHHHSRKSTYIDMGLDATVSWDDKKDLAFKNNFAASILIKSEITPLSNKKSRLTFKVYSYTKPYDVEVDVVVVFRARAVTNEVQSENPKQKWRINVEKASDGYTVKKTITVKNPTTGTVVSQTKETVHYVKVNGVVLVPMHGTVGGSKKRCYGCRYI